MVAAAPDAPAPPAVYRFSDVCVDTQAHEVLRDGRQLPLEPKAYAVLLMLLQHPGELVSRDDLLDAVWGHRHVTPGVLTRSVAQLRHALGDDPHAPRYIRTRHALGYEFVGELKAEAPVVEAPPPAPSPAVEPAPAPTSTPNAPTSSPVPTTPRWRRLAIGAAAVVALLLAGLLALRERARAPPAPPGDASIVVLPFASGDAAGDDYFARGVSRELHDAIATVPGVKIAPVPRRVLGGRDPARIGHRLGVATVLDGQLRRVGGRVELSAWLVDVASGATRWSGRFEREATGIFDLEANVAGEVVEALTGHAPGDSLARRLTPTRSLVAYDAYLRGLQSLDRSEGEARYRDAVAAFSAALRADPKFSRAQAGLCRAEITRFEDDMDAAAYGRAENACRAAAAMAPGLREVDLAMGELYRAKGRPADAIPPLERAAGDPALRPAAYAALARVYAGLSRPDLARAYFDRALRLQPNDPGLHRERGFAAYLAGDTDGAIAAFRTATGLAPGDERLWSGLGGLYLAAGRRADARLAFERSLALRPNYAALSNFGSLRYEDRDYAGAVNLYRRALAIDARDFRLWGNLGDALAALRGPSADVAAAYADAERRATRYTSIRADDAQAWALLGWYRANLGRGDAARDALARAEALGSEPAEVAFLGAQAYALLGDGSAARARLDRARAGGIPTQRMLASPVLRPLLSTLMSTPEATS
ncbi:tetratricopeptide repeat protein [Cognatilysobacter segetis]|uniref:tetratricopeptide repeat protein n=1 Tax=Cognatilysobacter segetis TaxID=2492394 RepID=UPI00105BCD6C|nr:tetratricopeptide repeat protein [Lysobacter segetis]